MDNSSAAINDLVLELSLAAALPMGIEGRNKIQASAAASALASRTECMDKAELRTYGWTIPPLLALLVQDVESPIAAKASKGLMTLMYSRICMASFIESDGLTTISRVLSILLAKHSSQLHIISDCRSVVEHLAICYREIARFYQWKLVNAGGIRHCVLLLKFGDITLQTAA